jgi:Tol biopolymer transport system component
LSSDEKRVFANTFPPAQSGVWVVDMERGTTSRLVPDATMPVPAPDGRTLAFTATREAGAGLFTVPLDALSESNGPGFVISAERKTPVQFTNDGQSLLYYASSPRGQDLWQLHLTGNAAPTRLVDSAANEIHGRLSPDERWLAYASDESGTWEVYVQSFPEAKSRLTVSASGGAEPIWRSDGRELYYLAEDHSLMAVDVTPGPTLRLTRPTVLFRPSVVGEPATYRSHYAVTADGQRFLVDVLRDPISDPITLLLNWAHGER